MNAWWRGDWRLVCDLSYRVYYSTCSILNVFSPFFSVHDYHFINCDSYKIMLFLFLSRFNIEYSSMNDLWFVYNLRLWFVIIFVSMTPPFIICESYIRTTYSIHVVSHVYSSFHVLWIVCTTGVLFMHDYSCFAFIRQNKLFVVERIRRYY
jgi:hypothetical protein